MNAHVYMLLIYFSTDPTLQFVNDDITVIEGEDRFAYLQLTITDVPAGGMEGVIEYELQVNPIGICKLMKVVNLAI